MIPVALLMCIILFELFRVFHVFAAENNTHTHNTHTHTHTHTHCHASSLSHTHLVKVMNVLSTANWLRTLKWSGSESFLNISRVPYITNGTTVGYHRRFGALSQLHVLRAGHFATKQQPIVMRDVFTRFVDGEL